MPKWGWYAIAGFLFYYLFLRRSISGGGLVTGTVGIGNTLIPTGSGATPYPGYPPGYAPPGAAAPGAPQPIIYQQAPQQNSTAQLLAGSGALIGGIGSAASGILGALGQSGVFGGGSASTGNMYPADSWSGSSMGGFNGSDSSSGGSSDFDFELF